MGRRQLLHKVKLPFLAVVVVSVVKPKTTWKVAIGLGKKMIEEVEVPELDLPTTALI
jgi:hypothetical protein